MNDNNDGIINDANNFSVCIRDSRLEAGSVCLYTLAHGTNYISTPLISLTHSSSAKFGSCSHFVCLFVFCFLFCLAYCQTSDLNKEN